MKTTQKEIRLDLYNRYETYLINQDREGFIAYMDSLTEKENDELLIAINLIKKMKKD